MTILDNHQIFTLLIYNPGDPIIFGDSIKRPEIWLIPLFVNIQTLLVQGTITYRFYLYTEGMRLRYTVKEYRLLSGLIWALGLGLVVDLGFGLGYPIHQAVSL